MNSNSIILLVVGVIVGAAALYLFQPEPAPPAAAPTGLVDGKYLVVDGESGHWIYRVGDKGLELQVKEWSAAGLHEIWELQSAYMPVAVDVGAEKLVNVPTTRYSTETGAFNVVHTFYRWEDGKLVRVPMEDPAAAQPPAGR